MSGQIDGIIAIDKPQGMSSHRLVEMVRRIVGNKKAGHAGTLDPMASGVMLVCVGRATKSLEYLVLDDKVYRARFRLGLTTDTLDITGRVLSASKIRVTAAEAAAALSSFVGEGEQVPPMFSAVKQEGRKLYDIARRGGTVERRARKINIFSIDMLSFDEAEGVCEIRVACSKGTFIRSLCADVGERLGTGAVLVSLRRERSGEFDISSCVTLEELERAVSDGTAGELFLPYDLPFKDYRRLTVDETQANIICTGGELTLSRVKGAPEKFERCAVYDEAGNLLIVAHPDFLGDALVKDKSFFGVTRQPDV